MSKVPYVMHALRVFVPYVVPHVSYVSCVSFVPSCLVPLLVLHVLGVARGFVCAVLKDYTINLSFLLPLISLRFTNIFAFSATDDRPEY